MEKDSVLDSVGLLFVASNALGIKYQIVWFKYILHFPGNTAYVQTVCGRYRFGRNISRIVASLRIISLYDSPND